LRFNEVTSAMNLGAIIPEWAKINSDYNYSLVAWYHLYIHTAWYHVYIHTAWYHLYIHTAWYHLYIHTAWYHVYIHACNYNHYTWKIKHVNVICNLWMYVHFYNCTKWTCIPQCPSPLCVPMCNRGIYNDQQLSYFTGVLLFFTVCLLPSDLSVNWQGQINENTQIEPKWNKTTFGLQNCSDHLPKFWS